MTRERFCPECGLVDQPQGSDRCAECGLTVLDDSDPANRDAIAEAIALRRELLQPRWMLPGGFAVAGAMLVAGMALDRDPAIAELLMWIGVFAWFALAGAVAKRRLSPQWHAAIRRFDGGAERAALRRRKWTSTTVIAAAVLVAFVGIQVSVGTDRLVYARGYPASKILTSMLAHGGAFHLLGNLVGLLAFGIAIDLRVGRLATLVILLAAGIGGSLAQAAYSPVAMLGFSGAILGLAGATVALMPNRKTVLFLQGIAVPMPAWLWSILSLGLITLTAWADTRANVGWVAHLGGFATGFVVALAMRRLPPTESFALYEQQRRDRIERLASR